MKTLVTIGLALTLLGGNAATAEPVAPAQGRPGIIRLGPTCYLDIGPEVPCDDRYADSEQIAGIESGLKDALKDTNNSPGAKADWDAWQATASITSFYARLTAYMHELDKQGTEHADAAKPFLYGSCEGAKEGSYSCEDKVIEFERYYWLAMQGDYNAQINVAGCFDENNYRAKDALIRWPCARVVLPNEAMMCAWFLVAMSSGHVKRPGEGDAAEDFGYVYECDKKPFAVRQVMLGTASDLFQRIYNRPLPIAR